jgi:hypothetical protein
MDDEILNPKSESLILDESDLEDFCSRNKLEFNVVNLSELESFDSQYGFIHTGEQKDQFNSGNINHWMFIYGRYVFDSYGSQSDFLLPEWTEKVQLKPERIQEFGSNVCGEYCCTFYHFVTTGVDPDDANMGLEYCDAMGLSQRRGHNDRVVQEAFLNLGGDFNSESDSDNEGGKMTMPTNSQKAKSIFPTNPGMPMTKSPESHQPLGQPSPTIPDPTRVDDPRPNQDTDMGIGTSPVPSGIIPAAETPETTMIPSHNRPGVLDVVNPRHGGNETKEKKGEEEKHEEEEKPAMEEEDAIPMPGSMPSTSSSVGAVPGLESMLNMTATPQKMPSTLGTGFQAPDVPADMQLQFPTIPKSSLDQILPNVSNKVFNMAKAIVGRASNVKRLNYDGTVAGAQKRVKGVINQFKTVQSFVPLGDIIENDVAMPFQFPNLTILTAVPQVVTLQPGIRKRE